MIAILLPSSICAQSFQLEYDKSGKIYGPSKLEDGEKLALGKAVFTLHMLDEDEAVIPAKFVLEGYDGVELGADLEMLRKVLAITKGVVMEEAGDPLRMLEKDLSYEYAIYRSKHQRSDKSLVLVRVEEGKVVEFVDMFQGSWRWDEEQVREVFSRKYHTLKKLWGQSVKVDENTYTWSNEKAKAMYHYERSDGHELSSIALTISGI